MSSVLRARERSAGGEQQNSNGQKGAGTHGANYIVEGRRYRRDDAVGWSRLAEIEGGKATGTKMDRLIAGHKRFLAEVFPGRRDHFHLLAEMQAPEWLFITCSDSRVVPDLILGTEPGDLFITR